MTKPFDIHGRTIVITGGSQGIGLVIAERLAAAGARIFIGDLQKPQREVGRYIKTDVTREEDVRGLMDRAAAEGGGPIEVLVNNVGVHRQLESLQRADAVDFDWCFAGNVKGTASAMKHAFPHMADGGAIVNISSLSAELAIATLGTYAASKAAMEALTRTAAVEFAPRGIRVNAVSPTTVIPADAGDVADDPLLAAEAAIYPMARVCHSEEVAAMVHFLAARDCSFLTGQTIRLCGGFTVGPGMHLWKRLGFEVTL